MSKSDSADYGLYRQDKHDDSGYNPHHTFDFSDLEALEAQLSTLTLESDSIDITEPIQSTSDCESGSVQEVLTTAATKKYNPDSCLFVASLVSSRTEDQLQESVTQHFKKWGKLDNVKVLKDPMNRPYSFVQFEDIQSANRALEESHNTLIDGRHIRVEKARVNRTLFVSKIGLGVKEETLKDSFIEHGPLESFYLIRNAATKEPKGSCFVKYRYREDAIKAFMHVKSQDRWTIEWASSQEKTPRLYDFYSIFVGQIHPELVFQDVEEKFSVYGQIDTLNYINRPNADHAFAFIKYRYQTSCVKAIEKEDGFLWHGKNIRVQFKETQGIKANRSQNSSQPKPDYQNRTQLVPQYIVNPYYHHHPQAYMNDQAPPGIASNSHSLKENEANKAGGGIWIPYSMLTPGPDGSMRPAQGLYFTQPRYDNRFVPSPIPIYSNESKSSSGSDNRLVPSPIPVYSNGIKNSSTGSDQASQTLNTSKNK